MEPLNTLTLSATALASAVLLKKLHQRLQLSMAKQQLITLLICYYPWE